MSDILVVRGATETTKGGVVLNLTLCGGEIGDPECGQLDVYEFCPAARQCILRWLSEDVPDARLHEAFLAFDDNGDRKLSATEFVQFLQYCAVRTVKQSCQLILDAKDMTGETGEGSAADGAFQDLVAGAVIAS